MSRPIIFNVGYALTLSQNFQTVKLELHETHELEEGESIEFAREVVIDNLRQKAATIVQNDVEAYASAPGANKRGGR